ncbi:T9SS type A sorting domain-containing protein [Chondrinema litorale]|uniref:type IX secretion system anionic LPS delivery protein PorZ n=1 Tax=Chondrinema litorale TaxID=2994555 RepID=UPI0025435890|nr:T9SS type A sorting domain-containing protein [Chondrinema litorale]UZR95803.1 T9SS type A sorting domain-containing protein [Chondrinema litorale]
MIKNSSFLLLIIIFFSLKVYPQNDIPLGTWRSHTSYLDAKLVEKAENIIYCASGQGLFSYNIEYNDVEVYSKLNDLSDASVAALAYSTNYNILMIGYVNGNIDLFAEDEIINVRLILNSDFRDKSINNLFVSGQYAYICTAFGVAVYDLEKEEIKETYAELGDAGEEIEVFDGAISGDSIYLATAEGVISASLSENANRLDYTNWNNIFSDYQLDIQQIEAFNGKIYFTVEDEGLYEYNQSEAMQLEVAQNLSYNSLSSTEEYLFLSVEGKIYQIDTEGNIVVIETDLLLNPQEVTEDEQGNLYIADNSNGLLQMADNAVNSISPAGIGEAEVSILSDAGNRILAFQLAFNESSYNPLNNLGSFSEFTDEGWKIYSADENLNATLLPNVTDLYSTTYNFNDDKLYLASFGNDILQWDLVTDSIVKLQNTPFLASGFQGEISGVSIDANGKLWVTVYGVSSSSPSVFLLDEGQWNSFSVSENVGRYPLGIISDDFGNVWIKLSTGLIVMDETGNYAYLNANSAINPLPNSEVLSMANDKESQVWIGTAEGVIEFFATSVDNIKQETVSATPVYESYLLLNDYEVTSIAIDGANRKWFGTKSGLWLFNEDGTELVEFYDEDNSPLFSSNILDVAIEDETGEVFIATDEGLLSFRGFATEASLNYDQAKIFPNPVREDFDGYISISGLTYNASVKITDISGKLIWDTVANGGTATWDARNYNGEKAKTGIYLVYVASESGEDVFQGKIAVIE